MQGQETKENSLVVDCARDFYWLKSCELRAFVCARLLSNICGGSNRRSAFPTTYNGHGVLR